MKSTTKAKHFVAAFVLFHDLEDPVLQNGQKFGKEALKDARDPDASGLDF